MATAPNKGDTISLHSHRLLIKSSNHSNTLYLPQWGTRFSSSTVEWSFPLSLCTLMPSLSPIQLTHWAECTWCGCWCCRWRHLSPPKLHSWCECSRVQCRDRSTSWSTRPQLKEERRKEGGWGCIIQQGTYREHRCPHGGHTHIVFMYIHMSAKNTSRLVSRKQ